MVFLLVARKVVLSFSVVLAFTILVLSSLLIYADNVNRMLESANGDSTAALAVGASVIHMCTVMPMLIMDFIKRRTIISTVLVEAIWLWIMWILWLGTAAFTTSTDNMSSWGCSAWLSSGCYKVKFLEIFCFINWIQLMIYTNTLFTLAIIGHLRGQPIWMSAVRDAPILSSPLALTMPNEPQFKPGFSLSTTSMSYSQQQYSHFSIPPLQSQGYPMPSTIPSEQFLPPMSPPLEQSSGSPITPYARQSSIPEAASIPPPTSMSSQTQPPPDPYSIPRNRMSGDLEMGSLQPPPPSYSDQDSRAGTPIADSRNYLSDSPTYLM